VALLGTVLRRLLEAKAPGVELSTIQRLSGPVHAGATAAFAESMGIVFAVAAAFMALAVVFSTRLRDPDSIKPATEVPLRYYGSRAG
jgi:hypothetical protein